MIKNNLDIFKHCVFCDAIFGKKDNYTCKTFQNKSKPSQLKKNINADFLKKGMDCIFSRRRWSNYWKNCRGKTT